MRAHESLILEIEEAVQRGSSDRRTDTLRSITDLFINGASRLNAEHVALFDSVILHLTDQIEIKALVELGERLAPITNAPPEVIRTLALHDDLVVAGAVIAHAAGLTDEDLVEIARTKSQAHLLAISSRRSVNEAVSDVLVQRGNDMVLCKVAGNSGARFSHAGFGGLMERARTNGALTEHIVLRSDVPPHLFQALVAQATVTVRRHLLAVAPPHVRADIERVLAKASDEVVAEIAAAHERGGAVETVRSMHQAGKLNEAEIVAFAKARQFDETVAALALLCGVPIEVADGLMRDDRIDPVMILCKAAGLGWRTLVAVISLRRGGRGASALDVEAIREDFDRLSSSTAQRVLRFWQVREAGARRQASGSEKVGDRAN